ncbi:MAG: hypothetical protein K2H96_01800 [Muribaculaceae bacterium]|nr:hypothetical protein [Muribaculaceae bacterium]
MEQYKYNVPDRVKDNPRVDQWYNEMVRDADGNQERLLHNLKAVCGYLIQSDELRKKLQQRNEELINSTNNIFADLAKAFDTREEEIKAVNLAKAFGIAAEPQAPYGK